SPRGSQELADALGGPLVGVLAQTLFGDVTRHPLNLSGVAHRLGLGRRGRLAYAGGLARGWSGADRLPVTPSVTLENVHLVASFAGSDGAEGNIALGVAPRSVV